MSTISRFDNQDFHRLRGPTEADRLDFCNSLVVSGCGGYVPSAIGRGVGTGFSAEVGQALLRRLEKMRIDKPAVAGLREPGTLWVRPQLLAEIEYRGYTEDQLLRHPSFKGMREDK